MAENADFNPLASDDPDNLVAHILRSSLILRRMSFEVLLHLESDQWQMSREYLSLISSHLCRSRHERDVLCKISLVNGRSDSRFSLWFFPRSTIQPVVGTVESAAGWGRLGTDERFGLADQ